MDNICVENRVKPLFCELGKVLQLLHYDLNEKSCKIDQIRVTLSTNQHYKATKLIFGQVEAELAIAQKSLAHFDTFFHQLSELHTKYDALLEDCGQTPIQYNYNNIGLCQVTDSTTGVTATNYAYAMANPSLSIQSGPSQQSSLNQDNQIQHTSPIAHCKRSFLQKSSSSPLRKTLALKQLISTLSKFKLDKATVAAESLLSLCQTIGKQPNERSATVNKARSQKAIRETQADLVDQVILSGNQESDMKADLNSSISTTTISLLSNESQVLADDERDLTDNCLDKTITHEIRYSHKLSKECDSLDSDQEFADFLSSFSDSKADYESSPSTDGSLNTPKPRFRSPLSSPVISCSRIMKKLNTKQRTPLRHRLKRSDRESRSSISKMGDVAIKLPSSPLSSAIESSINDDNFNLSNASSPILPLLSFNPNIKPGNTGESNNSSTHADLPQCSTLTAPDAEQAASNASEYNSSTKSTSTNTLTQPPNYLIELNSTNDEVQMVPVSEASGQAALESNGCKYPMKLQPNQEENKQQILEQALAGFEGIVDFKQIESATLTASRSLPNISTGTKRKATCHSNIVACTSRGVLKPRNPMETLNDTITSPNALPCPKKFRIYRDRQPASH